HHALALRRPWRGSATRPLQFLGLPTELRKCRVKSLSEQYDVLVSRSAVTLKPMQAEYSSLGSSISEAQLETDPYPIYKRLQERAPVCWVPSVNLWLVTRWRDVEHVCKHPEIFAAGIPNSALTRTIGSNMLHADGTYHRRLRNVVEPAFRAKAIGHYPTGMIETVAQELAAAISKRGQPDLVVAFAQPLPLPVLKQVLGLDVA